MRHIAVLGNGRIGQTIVQDLKKNKDIELFVLDKTIADTFHNNEQIRYMEADLSDKNVLLSVIGMADIVIGALPSTMGFETLKFMIENGQDYCDISFMEEDPLELDWIARKNKCLAIVDCGFAPGLSNLIAGHLCGPDDDVKSLRIAVGGNPLNPKWPLYYKPEFSPMDVIEEYTRPVRYKVSGYEHTGEPFEFPHEFEYRGHKLVQFTTDGLRTLLKTIDSPSMVEMTIRHQDHVKAISVLREQGFFSKESLTVNDQMIRPIDITSQLIFKEPKNISKHDHRDFTLLKVWAKVIKNNKTARITTEIYDEYDEPTGTTSMSRMTAFPPSIVSQMMLNGDIKTTGVIAPEILGQNEKIYNKIIGELHKRGIQMITGMGDVSS